jgi:hypothetical protein
MKSKHLAALLQPNLTTVKVIFPESGAMEYTPPKQFSHCDFPYVDIYGDVQSAAVQFKKAAPPAPPTAQQMPQKLHKAYTYKVLVEDGYKVGDTAVALVDRGLVLVKVVEVHETPQLDLDANFDYKWLVQRVDTTKLEKQLEAEQKFQSTILEIERRKQREKVKNELLDFYGGTEEGRALLEASIKQLGGE